MKARLQPLCFREANAREDEERRAQLATLRNYYGEEAELLPELPVGAALPDGVDAVLFPQLIGALFSHRETLRALPLPVIVLTSGFGTVEMWDWEIVAYLRGQLGLTVFSPYSVEMAKVVLRALSAKRAMRAPMRFVMFQDEPGEGMQANIFKRFYWWERECTEQIQDAFGVTILYRSWKKLGDMARGISDGEAEALWRRRAVPTEGVSETGILRAVKLYIAVKRVLDEIGGVYGVGANCLNESFHVDSTPCLAWNWLYEYDDIIWACEGDTVTLISKYILHAALQRPIMMTNIYPFLVGMAALKHEKIDRFPDIPDPDQHALGVHCGYFGFAPQRFCTHWTMRPKALEIVNDEAIVIDCRLQTGPVTLAKLHADMKRLTIIEAEIEDYVQYPGSDCRNGALLRYRNRSGHRVMEALSSHHAVILVGDVTALLLQAARVYGFETEVI
ncbi:MAG: hypothetical protein LBC26_06300 [Oscillospiraceae bacterium]|jgi:hypothetical protein|nr:hypothetical protein [Oscillospiraceae bacterium]